MPTIGSPELERTAKGLLSVDGKTFPLKSTRVNGRAEAGLAVTRLIQEYDNPYEEPLEVVYTLPLPADGAVIAYTIHLGARVVTGQIERRERAWERYRQALEEGRTAGLLEQERSDTFTQTLGNLAPGTAVRIEIDVLHPLSVLAGDGDAGLLWEYRFPTTAGVRFEGGSGRVPDRERLDVPRADEHGTPVRLGVDLVLRDGLPAVVSPHSSSHELTFGADGDATRATLANPARLDRDLVIRWRASRAGVHLSLVEGSGVAGDDDRYALLTLTPPRVQEATFPRDLTVLIDASGSMSGKPLEQAKQVAEGLLRGLAAADRFEILVFANETTALTRGLVPTDERRVDTTLRRLRELQAGGGTEMTTALRRALAPLRPDSQRHVVLITDGYIGFEHEIIAELLAGLPEKARLHVVGIGSAPNRALTRAASRAGRGVELLVGNDDDARDAAQDLQRLTAAPVLTEIRIGGSAVLRSAPERPGDVLAGRPALLALQVKAGGGTIEVEGKLAGRAEPWVERIEVGPRSTAAATRDGEPPALPVGALYGRERVEDCEARLTAAADGEGRDAILQEIENLGLRHRIVTRRTSLVAISEEAAVDPSQPRRRERLAVELPAGVSAEGVGLSGPHFAALLGRQFLSASGPRARAAFASMAEPSEGSLRRRGMRWFDAVMGRGSYQDQLSDRAEGVVIDGRVVRRDGDLLVVEFEIPARGLDVPEGVLEVEVEFADGTLCVARVLRELSTRSGDVEPGLTARLALRLQSDSIPTTAKPALVRWTGDLHGEVVVRFPTA